MRLLRFRGFNLVEDKLRAAPKNCPRCGRRMVTRTIYYECPGCGYTEQAPSTRPHRDTQPVDNLQHRLEEQIEEARHTDDPAERDFALAAVAPEMEREYRWLFTVGIVVYALVLFPWGMHIWTGMAGADYEPFRLGLGLIAAGALLLCIALMHPARVAKQLGIAVAGLLIPLQLAMPYLIPPEAIAVILGKWPHFDDYAAAFVAARIFYVAAVYCAWLAWYLIRERRLQGW